MMKLSFVVASTILVSFLAVSQSGVINEPVDVETYSIIDPIIKAILEAMRPKLANLIINNVNKTVTNPFLNATIVVSDISVKNADTYEIKNLKSTMIPLKLTNLTLTWNDITASASYDIDATVRVPEINEPFRFFGKGKAKATLNGLFLTIGANVELKNNAIQIKPKGLFGFDMSIKKAIVTLTSLMGSEDFGNAVGTLISKMIPEAVDVLKKPVFDSFQDDIIKIVNQVLKSNKTSLLTDEEPMPEFPFESFDLSEKIGAFFKQPFDLGMEETEFKFESEF